MLKVSLRLLAVMLFLSCTANAAAEGFALYEYSARGVALGGSVVARKPDPSSVAYNPALIARLPGTHFQGGFTTINPSGKMDYTDTDGTTGTSRLRRSVWYVPNMYFTHQINDDFTFGIGEFTRFGLGFEYPHDWPGRFNIYEVNLQTASLNPNIAWRATDNLSLAAGLELVYVNLDLKKRANVDVGGIGSFEVDSNIRDADDLGLGFNLAAHYQFNDHWGVGLSYRSQVRVHAHGDIEYTYMGYQGLPMGEPLAEAGYGSVFKDGGADSTVVLPDSIAGGVAWTPVPEFSLEVGAIWTRWSSFRTLRIHLNDSVGVTESKKDWKDAWRFNIGAEYDALDWLTLRAGYVYDRSPMTSPLQDYLVPTNDRSIYSAGLGFHWDDWTVDLAYAYIHANTRYYTPRPEDGVLHSKTKDGRTNLFSVSVGYEF